jgi:aminoglycoside phosphotransferase (APT) family kinase protein
MIDTQALLEKINRWLAQQHGDRYSLAALSSANGGYSNITLMGELANVTTGDPSGIVVRIQPEGAAVFPDCDVQAQYQTMHLLKQAGLPVPSLLGLEMDPAVVGAPFFIMSVEVSHHFWSWSMIRKSLSVCFLNFFRRKKINVTVVTKWHQITFFGFFK